MRIFSNLLLGVKKTTSAGSLRCPTCQSYEIKFVERIGLISRWRCKKCGLYFRYDQRPMPLTIEQRHDSKARKYANPYNSFTKGLKIVKQGG